jgi:hypothetical protein
MHCSPRVGLAFPATLVSVARAAGRECKTIDLQIVWIRTRGTCLAGGAAARIDAHLRARRHAWQRASRRTRWMMERRQK